MRAVYKSHATSLQGGFNFEEAERGIIGDVEIGPEDLHRSIFMGNVGDAGHYIERMGSSGNFTIF